MNSRAWLADVPWEMVIWQNEVVDVTIPRHLYGLGNQTPLTFRAIRSLIRER